MRTEIRRVRTTPALARAPDVPGLRLVTDFLSTGEEQDFLRRIDVENAERWRNDIDRRTQHYGFRYDYKRKSIVEYLGPLPGWLMFWAQLLYARGFLSEMPNQVIVNEYLPGQGISAHKDARCFEDEVASISLGSTVVMRLREEKTHRVLDFVLPRCSLLILKGEARNRWTHEIVGCKADVIDGVSVPRMRRVSITFRTVRALA